MSEKRKTVKPKRILRSPHSPGKEIQNSGTGLQKPESGAAGSVSAPQPAELLPGKVSADLTANLDFFKQVFADAPDFVLREIPFNGQCQGRLAVAYIDGLVNVDVVNRDILAPLIFAGGGPAFCLDQNPAVNTAKMKKSREMQDALQAILTGLAVVMVDGLDTAYLFDVIHYPARPVGSPMTESTARGPQEGFTEVLRINITQVRRRLKDPDLKVKLYKVGQRTQTEVALFYIRDLTPPDVLQKIEQRLQQIQIDGILDTGYIEQMIADHPNSVFPQSLTVERPDRVVANLLEGRA
ncbi:MAG: spore germination protein, partial [Firmicutes bacterium]|nr:spore germination protein [Bacillota bacterium]